MNIPINAWQTSKVAGRHTLTRQVDPTSNVDKYRRFIVLWDVDNPKRKALITHTGRWTDATARGDWSGGTYRFQKFSHVNWELDANASEYLGKHTQRKLGGYGVALAHAPLDDRWVQVAIDKSGINAVTAQPSAPTPTNGGSVDLQGAVNGAQGQPLTMPPGSAEAQAVWLLQATGRSNDQLELLGHYAHVSARIKEDEARLLRTKAELESALHAIMLK